MTSKKSKKNKDFKIRADIIAKDLAEYTAKYNAWRIKMFTLYIESNANPKIEGEINDEKLKAAGIKIMTDGDKSWLTQNDKVISRVLEPKPFEFDFENHLKNN